jgi:hypothetical protein
MEKIYKNFEDLTSAELWAIRSKVVVNSVYLADYENQYGISEVSLCNFFDGYYDYMWELAIEKYGRNVAEEIVRNEFDTEDNLYSWFNCYEDFDWIVYDYEKDVKDLVKSIIEDFEDELSADKVREIIFKILQSGKYTFDELWYLDIYDSTKMFDLLSEYGDYKK